MAYKNKEDQKAAQRKWYLKNRAKVIEKSRLRKLENPEREAEYKRKHYYKPSEIEGVSVGVLQRRKYVANNQEQYKKTNQEWRDANKEHTSKYNKEYWLKTKNERSK
jgi:hypothetical protein